MFLRRTLMALVVPFGLVLSLLAQELGRIDTDREKIEERGSVVFEGIVVDSNRSPAEGTVVVSSAGGRAVTDRSGSYRLEVDVPADAQSVQITAVGGAGGSRVASTSVGLAAGSALARVAPLELASESACQPSWLPTFGQEPGVSFPVGVRALAVFDDGDGPALYVGGDFMRAGGITANSIAKWDGASWNEVGAGVGGFASNYIRALAVFDDGSGPALYAGGLFSTAGGVAANRIAKWNGTSWAPLGSGMSTGFISALAVFDDGGGPALYVGGIFGIAGGVPAQHIAKWNGASWASLGSGVSGGTATLGTYVTALAVFDDGSGPSLLVGGSFTAAGGVPANYIASWDGASWAPLGSGTNDEVNALTVFDDGGGPALYAGGLFTTAGGAGASRIARWNGVSWAPLGSGADARVDALAVFDGGNGPALCAGGAFSTAGGTAANRIATWDGTSWAALDSGTNGSVAALTVFDAGNGPALYAGGPFSTAGGLVLQSIAAWDGSSWTLLGDGINGTSVYALKVFDDGGGPALFVGGTFNGARGVSANNIAKWNGTSWTALGSGLTSSGVSALEVFDDGNGPVLYAGGDFGNAGGVTASNIARWDGSSWTALGSGTNQDVFALTVFDDGGGPALYAGGFFTSAGGAPASYIAKWNGSSWSALGSGMNNQVNALAVFDDGSGAALYAGGRFTTAGGVAANRIAKWNGAAWVPLGSGVGPGFLSEVWALTVVDGEALYAGGAFTTAGGQSANRIAKWDGSSWAPLGSGMNGIVSALLVLDEGSGQALYAGGSFSTAGGSAARGIAKWDGSSWTPLGSGVGGVAPGVNALTGFNDRTGPALYVGGTFGLALDSSDSHLAKWGCPDTSPPAITCPSPVTVLDRGAPGQIVTFTVTASDEEDPTPSLVCVPPSGSFFPRGKTLVTCTSTDFSGNQSTCHFTVEVVLGLPLPRPTGSLTPP